MKTHQISDQELISQYLQGNEQSFEKLFRRHKDKIYTYIVILVKDKDLADDMFQDTFIKVINTLKSGYYNEEGKFISWVYRIAHNLIIDHFRRNTKMPIFDSKNDTDIFRKVKIYDDNIEDKMVEEQVYKDIRNLVELLPSEQKDVLLMRHYANLSFKEIADISGVSINTALGRMRYALINMRKLIDEKKINLNF
ncbi:MAG: sigma-70 family RNA polymerase sigma factor [Bacteroidales bacterium]|nr:sigma-70 family RNA polymerase sigma factor [Bacteroidales bacterium]